jgi:transposase-like protein
MEQSPMSESRRHFSGDQNLLEKVPLSEVCRKHDIQPTLFYLWQKKLFEDGAVVFESRAGNARQQAAEEKKLAAIESKLQQKNEVMAELMGEHVALKKKLGLI